MRLCVFGVLTVRRSRVAAICTAAAIVVFGAAAQSAAAASLDEGLTGAGPSTGADTYGDCYAAWVSGMGFSASGTASGPHPGTFSEVGGLGVIPDFTGHGPLWTAGFHAKFKITSGTKTITGSFAGSTAGNWWSVSGAVFPICAGVHLRGFHLSSFPLTFTATIDGQTVHGTGAVSGTFYVAAGAKDNVSVTLTMPGGQITGTVTDTTGDQLSGICVHAYDSGGKVLASSRTDSSGAYTLSGVPVGSAEVGFSTGCGAGDYIPQYYDSKRSLARADRVTVTTGTTSGIDAAMVPGGQISGKIIARATRAPLAGMCVRAYNGRRGVVASAQTNASGNYTLSVPPTRSYRVGFIDCSHHRYLRQYYHDKPSWASATRIAVTAGTTTSRINAAMRR